MRPKRGGNGVMSVREVVNELMYILSTVSVAAITKDLPRARRSTIIRPVG